MKGIFTKLRSVRSVGCALSLFFMGCETTRVASDMLAGGAGAFVGNRINKKYGAPVGAAMGVIGAEAVQQIAEKHSEHEYSRGYDRGKADGLKQMMEGLEANHLPQGEGTSAARAKIHLPESTAEDGAHLVEREEYVPTN